jgi:putative redox protein
MHSFNIKYTSELRTEMTHIQSGTVVITDAPLDNKGKGGAFSPTDLAAASLCSCMMTIMGISGREHGFSIDGAEARVTKVMASDPRRIAEVIIEIDFPEFPYSGKHIRIIEHISKNCPVALSLHPDLKQTITLNFKQKI